MNKDCNLNLLIPQPKRQSAECQHQQLSCRNKLTPYALPAFGLIMTCAALILLFGSLPATAQTFNEANNLQLARDPVNELGCARLVGGSPRDPFTEEPLNFGTQLADICGPVRPGSGQTPGPNSTAGSGATSTTADVEKRMRKIREDEDGEKTDGVLGAGLSVWISANYQDLDRNTTNFEDGYDSSIWGGTVGGDLLFNDSWVVGLAFNLSRWDGDFRNGGEFDTDTYGPIIYASFFTEGGFFSDVVLSLMRKDVSEKRTRLYVNELDDSFGGQVSGDPNDNEFSVGLSLGWDHTISQFSIGPRLALDYVYTDFDSYTEKGTAGPTGLELAFDADSKVSLQTSLGAQASVAISTAIGVILPQVNMGWVHEYADDQRSITVHYVQDQRSNPEKFSFQNDKPDRDFFELNAGLLFVMPKGIQAFISYQTLISHRLLDSHAGKIGLRYEM